MKIVFKAWKSKLPTNIFVWSDNESKRVISSQDWTSSDSVFGWNDWPASVENGNGVHVSMYVYICRGLSWSQSGVIIPQVISRKSNEYIGWSFAEDWSHQDIRSDQECVFLKRTCRNAEKTNTWYQANTHMYFKLLLGKLSKRNIKNEYSALVIA